MGAACTGLLPALTSGGESQTAEMSVQAPNTSTVISDRNSHKSVLLTQKYSKHITVLNPD